MTDSAQKRSDARDRILQAADDLGELGYSTMSMRDVAERAGVNKALVFYYFNSKKELFEHVLEGYYRTQLLSAKRAFDEGGDARERLHRSLDAYLGFTDENQRYIRIIQHEISRGLTHTTS